MKEEHFDDFLAEQLKDPEIKAEWDALEPEFAAAQAEIDAHVAEEKQVAASRRKSIPIRPSASVTI